MFSFGQKSGCFDYMDLIEPSDKEKILISSYHKVSSALKSQPMRSLRGFSKRRLGTAPTILGVHASRRTLLNAPGTISFVLNLDDSLDDGSEEMMLYGLQAGEFVVFRETDGYPINILQLSDNYKVRDLTPKTKISGNFILQTDDVTDDDLVIFYLHPGWTGEVYNSKMSLRTRNRKLQLQSRHYISLKIAMSSLTYCQNVHLIN